MRRRSYATVVMLTLGLAACSSGGGSDAGTADPAPTGSMTYHGDAGSPAASASSTASPSTPSATSTRAPSSTGTVTPPAGATSSVAMPDLPAAAKAHTPDGAAAFARYYLELVNYAWQKPDPAPLRAHALPTCTTCEGWAQDASNFVKNHTRIDRAPFAVESSDAGMTLEWGAQASIVVGRQTPYRMIGGVGAGAKPAPAEQMSIQVFAEWSGSGWKIAAIEDVA